MSAVIALGFFDGVHVGHAALLKKTVERARSMNVRASALTFDTPPTAMITGCRLPLIVTVEQRAAIMREQFGLDEVIVLPFTEALMNLPFDAFVPTVLRREYGAVGVVAGHDYTYGRYGEGTVAKLSHQCEALGMSCDIIERVTIDGVTVSSTVIRKLLAQGVMERVNRYLGRPYSLRLPVQRGRRLGQQLGFPTVNMAFPDELQQPALGVYRSRVVLNGQAMPAITSIGRRPTVSPDGDVVVESHIYDFNGDLYGQTLGVELLSFMRREKTFNDLEELKRQVAHDMAQGRSALQQ